MKAIVMAGGSGTRLWPLSRAGHPKQFLALDGQLTMFQATLDRLSTLKIESSVTICSEEHRFFVAEQLRQRGDSGSIILEPFGRNTAPAIALAAMREEADALLLVLAADHVITDLEAFSKSVTAGIPLAESGKLVTFGVVPAEPHTGYGYIKAGSKIDGGFFVSAFKEKPELNVAKSYIEDGGYYWNSGMFLLKAEYI